MAVDNDLVGKLLLVRNSHAGAMGKIDRRTEAPCEPGNTADMIIVLVRDQDAIQ